MKKKMFEVVSYGESNGVISARIIAKDKNLITALNGLKAKPSLRRGVPTEPSIDTSRLFGSTRCSKQL